MSTRYLFEDPLPIMVPVLTAQVVANGDLIGTSSGNAIRPEDVSWASAVATPSAPTVANGAVAVGSELTNSATGVKISYQFPWGEGALSAAGSGTPTAGALLKVSGSPLVPPSPALYTNIYVETSAGSGTYKLWGITYGGTVMVNSYGAGAVPAASPVASDATAVTQFNFAATLVGVSAQKKAANVDTVVGNSKANLIRVDTCGQYLSDCASATFAVGDLVGPAKQTGNLLESQKVVGVAHETLAVGRVTEAGTTVTTVKWRLLSQLAPSAGQV